MTNSTKAANIVKRQRRIDSCKTVEQVRLIVNGKVSTKRMFRDFGKFFLVEAEKILFEARAREEAQSQSVVETDILKDALEEIGGDANESNLWNFIKIPKRDRLEFFKGAIGTFVRKSRSITHQKSPSPLLKCVYCGAKTTLSCQACKVSLCDKRGTRSLALRHGTRILFSVSEARRREVAMDPRRSPDLKDRLLVLDQVLDKTPRLQPMFRTHLEQAFTEFFLTMGPTKATTFNPDTPPEKLLLKLPLKLLLKLALKLSKPLESVVNQHLEQHPGQHRSTLVHRREIGALLVGPSEDELTNNKSFDFFCFSLTGCKSHNVPFRTSSGGRSTITITENVRLIRGIIVSPTPNLTRDLQVA